MQVRSSGRTPNGSMLSHPGVPSGLPKIGAKNTSPSGSSNNVKSGKLQPVRIITAVRSPKVDVKQISSAVKSRSSLSTQKSPNTATKVPSASRNPKSSPGISPELQNKSLSRTGRENYSKAQGFGFAEKIVGPGFPEQVSLGAKDAHIKDSKIVPLIGARETAENMTSSKETAENETHSHRYLKTDSLLPCNTSKKEEAPAEDQIAGLVSNSGTVEFESNLSNPPPTSPSAVTSSPRVPFSAKDSFYNIDAPPEVLSGSLVMVDKTTILASPESIFQENS